jgi:hypothetical protein
MFNDHIYPPAKDYVSQPLYVRQPCSLQIIQLVECSPPPPPQPQQQQKYPPSRLSSSSYSDSDSDSDSDSGSGSGSAYDSSSSSLSAGPSYCSSAQDSSAPQVPPSFDNRDPSVDDTYHTRQRRVSLWRDAVCPKDVVPSPVSTSTSTSSPAGESPPPFAAPLPVGCGWRCLHQTLLLFTHARTHARMHSSSRFSFPKAKNSRW